MDESRELTAVSTLREALAVSMTARSTLGRTDARLDELLCRVRNEYLEMPGLRLTLGQAQRMWQLRRTECEALLDALVDSGFLTRTSTGAFMRAGSGKTGA